MSGGAVDTATGVRRRRRDIGRGVGSYAHVYFSAMRRCCARAPTGEAKLPLAVYFPGPIQGFSLFGLQLLGLLLPGLGDKSTVVHERAADWAKVAPEHFLLVGDLGVGGWVEDFGWPRLRVVAWRLGTRYRSLFRLGF